MVKFVCPEGKRRQGQLCFQAPKGAADGEETERMCGTEPDRTSSGDPAKSAKLQAVCGWSHSDILILLYYLYMPLRS